MGLFFTNGYLAVGTSYELVPCVVREYRRSGNHFLILVIYNILTTNNQKQSSGGTPTVRPLKYLLPQALPRGSQSNKMVGAAVGRTSGGTTQ